MKIPTYLDGIIIHNRSPCSQFMATDFDFDLIHSWNILPIVASHVAFRIASNALPAN
jgi:hypothetical protein